MPCVRYLSIFQKAGACKQAVSMPPVFPVDTCRPKRYEGGKWSYDGSSEAQSVRVPRHSTVLWGKYSPSHTKKFSAANANIASRWLRIQTGVDRNARSSLPLPATPHKPKIAFLLLLPPGLAGEFLVGEALTRDLRYPGWSGFNVAGESKTAGCRKRHLFFAQRRGGIDA